MGCSALLMFLLSRDLVLYVCVGEHVCALVFVFPEHEHDWFRIQVGHDEVLVV